MAGKGNQTPKHPHKVSTENTESEPTVAEPCNFSMNQTLDSGKKVTIAVFQDMETGRIHLGSSQPLEKEDVSPMIFIKAFQAMNELYQAFSEFITSKINEAQDAAAQQNQENASTTGESDSNAESTACCEPSGCDSGCGSGQDLA